MRSREQRGKGAEREEGKKQRPMPNTESPREQASNGEADSRL
jgi:hypothetical protein